MVSADRASRTSGFFTRNDHKILPRGEEEGEQEFIRLTSGSSLREVKEKDPTATSTYSFWLSQSPSPPGRDRRVSDWEGTFGKLNIVRRCSHALVLTATGQLNDLTPPRSPATLYYRGMRCPKLQKQTLYTD